MIFEHSRYASVAVEPTMKSDGTVVQAIHPQHYYGTSFAARKHTVSEDDRLEEIAGKYYKDPEMWWVIAIANPEVLYPDQLEPGTVIRIPNVTPLR